MFRTSPVVAEDEWHLDLQVEGHIAVLTLNRPDKLNAWSWESTRQLGARAEQIRFDERVRVVVLRGEGTPGQGGGDQGRHARSVRRGVSRGRGSAARSRA
jgi:enoyl-CoA hydratase/carnithine racemase